MKEQKGKTGAELGNVTDLAEIRTLPDGKILFPTGVVSFTLFDKLYHEYSELHRRLDFLVDTVFQDDFGADVALDLAFETVKQTTSEGIEKYWKQACNEKELAGGSDIITSRKPAEVKKPITQEQIDNVVKTLKEARGFQEPTSKAKRRAA
jgi:hypothetical protein